jgi:hypothetical protein
MSTVLTTSLLDFYVRLGEDGDLLEEFERDPQAAFERAGFSGDALATLLEGDLDTIRATIRDETRSVPRSEYGSGEHKGDDDDDDSGEHKGDEDDDSGEHTGDDEGSGEHTGDDDDSGEHTGDDDDSGEHTGDDDDSGEHTGDE